MIDIEERLSLCTFIGDYKTLIEDLGRERDQMENRLAEAADLMADAGRIHNTPKAKADWIAGK